jgi:hypothetical protein
VTRRAASLLGLVALVLLVAAPVALGHDNGQGTYGEVDDKVTTYAGFIVIAFFPLLIFVLSVVQGALDKRKHRRMDAKRARASSADWRGGW